VLSALDYLDIMAVADYSGNDAGDYWLYQRYKSGIWLQKMIYHRLPHAMNRMSTASMTRKR
jgi:hypothetical protein